MTPLTTPAPRTKSLVLAVVVVAGGVVAYGYYRLWLVAPVVGALLLTHCLAFLVGLGWRDRRRKALAVVSDWHDEELAAIKLADAKADNDDVTVYTQGFEPEPWLDGGERAITERCGCGRPGNVRRPDGTVACFTCDRALRPAVYGR